MSDIKEIESRIIAFLESEVPEDVETSVVIKSITDKFSGDGIIPSLLSLQELTSLVNEWKNSKVIHDWYGAIQESGNQMRKEGERQRQELENAPHKVFTVPNCYGDKITIGLWDGDDFVLEADIRNGRIDINSIRRHSYDFIDAINRVRMESKMFE